MAFEDGLIPDLRSALLVTKQYCYLEPAENTYNLSLSLELNQSRARNSYRPYIIAAFFVHSHPPREGIIEADQAKWESNKFIVEGLLNKQAAMDGILEEIPDGWDVLSAKEQLLCGCEGVKGGIHSFVV